MSGEAASDSIKSHRGSRTGLRKGTRATFTTDMQRLVQSVELAAWRQEKVRDLSWALLSRRECAKLIGRYVFTPAVIPKETDGWVSG
jgi:hypothetical protein